MKLKVQKENIRSEKANEIKSGRRAALEHGVARGGDAVATERSQGLYTRGERRRAQIHDGRARTRWHDLTSVLLRVSLVVDTSWFTLQCRPMARICNTPRYL